MSGRSSQQQPYRDSPASSSASSALSINESNNNTDSMKLKTNLASIGDTVKNKLGGLLGSFKNNASISSPPQLPESPPNNPPSLHVESSTTSNAGSGRVFGHVAGAVRNENHRPFRNATGHENNDNTTLSRSTSPNPFKMASSGINRQTNFSNNNVSPFARFDGGNNNRASTQSPPNNIFDDV